MRIGIIALLHESNTFSAQPTTLESFRQNLLLAGEPIREALADSHHEVGGFLGGLAAAGAEAVPLFAARALPSGTIRADAFDILVAQLLDSVAQSSGLDGILVAPHGATVSQRYADADGHWLSALRELVGPEMPIIGTLDAHANLSQQMVDSCTALIAYRTNPHLDQRERGAEAAGLMVRTLRQEIAPVMSAVFPPLAISIEKQCTEEAPLTGLYALANEQLQDASVLSNSILLGFPYADVEEMGAAVIVVTDGNQQLADQLSGKLAMEMWNMRRQFCSRFVSVDEALARLRRKESETSEGRMSRLGNIDIPGLATESSGRICLLDMGDNVGGGSAADGTELLAAIHASGIGPAFVCIFDPQSVAACDNAGVGSRIHIRVGGKTDDSHGVPVELSVEVVSLHHGQFRESLPRHGGITEFDQGRTAVCLAESGLTLMLTSKRMVPFSLQQLYSCGVDPQRFRILVAKGVNAPLAAYRDVCDDYIRVNTLGSTCADLSRMQFHHRRRSMFPMEPDTVFATSTQLAD